MNGMTYVLVGISGLILAAGAIKGSAALWVAQTAHAGSTYIAVAIYDPSNIGGSSAGNTVALTWTDPGNNHGHGNGYAVYAYHFGPNTGACSTTAANYTAAPAAFLKGMDNTLTTGNDAGTFSGSDANYTASWTCYMVRTWLVPGQAFGTWTSATVPTWSGLGVSTQYFTPSPIQLGFVAQSVTFNNTGVAGTVAAGDNFVITYDQPTTAPNLGAAGLNLDVCFDMTFKAILIGQTWNGSGFCQAATSVGYTTGGTFTT